LHMAQLIPLPLTVCCFSKIQIGFTFLVPAHLGSPGKRAVKRECVCVCVYCHAWHRHQEDSLFTVLLCDCYFSEYLTITVFLGYSSSFCKASRFGEWQLCKTAELVALSCRIYNTVISCTELPCLLAVSDVWWFCRCCASTAM